MNGIHYWNGKQMVACGDDVIDYPKLLRKYVEHVVDCQYHDTSEYGPGFMNCANYRSVTFTQSETALLNALARECEREAFERD